MMAKQTWRKYRRTIWCVLLGMIGFLIIYSHSFTDVSPVQLTPCNIDVLDPWDAAIRPFIVLAKPLRCNDKHNLVYFDNRAHLHINETMATAYGLNFTSLRCTSQTIHRVDGDMNLNFDSEVPLNSFPVLIKSHLIRMTCKDSSDTVLYDMAHFNPFWNENAKPDETIDRETDNKLSVVLLGIDSVSRSHAIRYLPKSFQFLSDHLHVYDFKGYSKVGENTWPNIVPMLTGQSHRAFPMVEHIRMHADRMPMVWYEDAVKEHVATFFAEDRPDISCFNYVKSGFKYSPTDVYYRPYTLAEHVFEPVIGKPLKPADWDCYGNRNHFDIHLDYLKGFMSKYRGKRKLGLMWSNSLGHESFPAVSNGDESLLEFIKWSKSTNAIKNTIFIVLSDHGFRIGGASLTHVGRAENNKPWFMVHVPKDVVIKNPWIDKILKDNTKRLVTAFDVYQTIMDVMHNRPFVKQPQVPVGTTKNPRSLFAAIPEGRTCIDAGVEAKYCSCQKKQRVQSTTTLSRSMANYLVTGINNFLQNHTDICFPVTLHNITEVYVSYSNTDVDNLPPGQEEMRQKDREKSYFRQIFGKSDFVEETLTGRYTLAFYTQPKSAFYEGYVDYAQFELSNKLTMVGEPTRLDRYGNQSHCVNEALLKPFCICKS